MPSTIPDDFQLDLEIALRMVEQDPRHDFATRLPHLRDQGAKRIAARVIERLRLSGWQIEAPPLASDRED